VRRLGPFVAAIEGDDSELRTVAGPDAMIDVAPDLSSVLVVRPTADGKQTGTVAIVGSDGVGNAISTIHVPRSFPVTGIRRDGAEFVLTSADGRTVHGTPDQFAVEPRLLNEDVNPRYAEQLDQLFLETHLRPPQRFASPRESPTCDAALREPADVVAAGEAMVAIGDDEVWLDFECAGPGKVTRQLPHARELLADLAGIGRVGAEFLWATDPEGDKAAFLEVMAPTSLVILSPGDFEIHYEGTSDVLVMDGYWLAVQFTADRTPVDHSVEA
jgi:hypothetical protein